MRTPVFILCATATHDNNEVTFYVKDNKAGEADIVSNDMTNGQQYYVKKVIPVATEDLPYTQGGYTHLLDATYIKGGNDGERVSILKDTAFYRISSARGEYATNWEPINDTPDTKQ